MPRFPVLVAMKAFASASLVRRRAIVFSTRSTRSSFNCLSCSIVASSEGLSFVNSFSDAKVASSRPAGEMIRLEEFFVAGDDEPALCGLHIDQQQQHVGRLLQHLIGMVDPLGVILQSSRIAESDRHVDDQQRDDETNSDEHPSIKRPHCVDDPTCLSLP